MTTMATIEDFSKLELTIVTVLEAVRIEGSEKLIKLLVNDGSGKRQILAGVGKTYQPETLIGKQLVAITNLEPRMMMGEKSFGMILATGDDLSNIILIQPERSADPGSKLR